MDSQPASSTKVQVYQIEELNKTQEALKFVLRINLNMKAHCTRWKLFENLIAK